MNCFEPGRVVVGPGPEWSPDGEQQLREELGADFEILHDVSDVLRANDVPIGEEFYRHKGRLPFVARVPEGSEEEIAGRLRLNQFSRGRIDGAVPDYLVRPNASIDLNTKNISEAIASARADVASSECGRSCTVGIIDSGLDFDLMTDHRGSIHRQLNAKDPLNPDTRDGDRTGHGTLVASIVNKIAPSARIIPVKAFDTDGTLSDVLAGLYLAHTAGPCDVINLSLSMSCDPDHCEVCSSPLDAAMNIKQLKFFFDRFVDFAGDVVLIAAAGNNRSRIASPAAFEKMIAVGSYHFRNLSPSSQYKAVPSDRFILGPDGAKVVGEELASRPGLRRDDLMFGTSFATAFVSGVAARVICGLKGGPCPHGSYARRIQRSTHSVRQMVLDELAANADCSWPGYDPTQHGLGRLRLTGDTDRSRPSEASARKRMQRRRAINDPNQGL
ncbi:S8 family peptidase [Oricola sp.]|uniref:S8 family peptidase n=1 Tax=Oricola sp. TaxID=1979950 RepID=UPI003BAB3699